ncbi:MAG: helix-turn-helix domain-containing protein [Pseudomonadota bacterium]
MLLLDALGKRWTLRVLWELRDGRLSFRDLRSRCDDVSPTSLNARLKELRELELVDLEESGFGYTVLGAELGEHLLRLSSWSEKWDQQSRR